MSASNDNRPSDERNSFDQASEHGGVAELDKPATRAARPEAATVATSAVFRMAKSRSGAGFMKLATGAASAALGAFLLAEVPKTPGLALNLGIIGGIGIVAAAVLTLLALRDLTGRLAVNENGISLSPGWAGFNLTWKQVSSWQTTDEDELPPQMQQLKLWRRGEVTPIVVDTGWLSVESRGTLRKILHQVAGDDRLS